MSYTGDVPIRCNDDELTAGIPTPRPSPTTAYTEADKIAIVSRLVNAWFLCPQLRLGQLIYVAAVNAEDHVSTIKDTELAKAVEKWVEDYK